MKIKSRAYPDGSYCRKPDRVASTSHRLKEAMDIREKKQIDLVRETGIDKGSISYYLSGRYEPKQDAVNKLAATLNVSGMWLQGYDVPMNPASYSDLDEENPYELELRDVFGTLDVDDQIYVTDWVRQFSVDPEKAKSSPSEPQLTEGERTLLNLFRQVPEDRRQMVLQMIQAALSSPK